MVGSQLYKARISSTSAWRALSSGRDLEGSGCQSSVAEVWRTSKYSPGAEAVVILCLGDWNVRNGRLMFGVRMSDRTVNI